jgi:inner membrane transporter RhtA
MSRLPPVWLVLIGILSVQFGAGIAKSLFDEIAPTVIVWLRLVTSAIVLTLVARPVLRHRSAHDWMVVAGLGVSLGVMNWAIYQSFARIPLGIAVTIEFVGPLTLAVLGSRRPRDFGWVLLAAVGVALLGFERGELTSAAELITSPRGTDARFDDNRRRTSAGRREEYKERMDAKAAARAELEAERGAGVWDTEAETREDE